MIDRNDFGEQKEVDRITMTKNEKLDHMLSLTEEVNILTQRLQPQATGYIQTTINTLRERIDELREELSD